MDIWARLGKHQTSTRAPKRQCRGACVDARANYSEHSPRPWLPAFGTEWRSALFPRRQGRWRAGSSGHVAHINPES